MVRVITQQTFNEVVKENMEEFNMSMAEAVQEAVQQFEAQGVDLSNIVTGSDAGLDDDPVTQCVKRLQANSYEENLENLREDLKLLKEQCNKEIAKKVRAGKEGAYDALVNMITIYKEDEEILILVFESLISLMSGYPDLLNEKGIKEVTSIITKSKNMGVIKLALKWCRICCVKHENNRQAIFDSYIIRNFSKLLESPAMIEVCGLIRSLCFDDDIRVEISKAHEHARSLAVDLLCPLTVLLEKHAGQPEEVSEILHTMATLIVRNEFCAKVEEAGGLNHIANIMSEHHNSEKVNRTCFLLLKTLVGNDDVKAHLFQNQTLITLIMHAVERHKAMPASAAAGLGLIAAMALRSPSNSQLLCEFNAPEIIINTMKVHPTNSVIQRHGAWAIRNIVSRRKDLNVDFIKLGVKELLTDIMKNHKDCCDDAKAALRDLGCDVKLIERWTGKGTALKH